MPMGPSCDFLFGDNAGVTVAFIGAVGPGLLRRRCQQTTQGPQLPRTGLLCQRLDDRGPSSASLLCSSVIQRSRPRLFTGLFDCRVGAECF